MPYIEVSLDDFSDDDILDECRERGLEKDIGDFDDDEIAEAYKNRLMGAASGDEVNPLEKIWIADREGRKDEAYALMREYVLDKLGKVL